MGNTLKSVLATYMRNSIAGNPHLLEIEKLLQRNRYARFVCWLQKIFIIKIQKCRTIVK